MALDDIVRNRAMGVGEVKSSLEAEDVEMTEEFWEVMALYHPEMLIWDARWFSEKQIRYFLMLLDKALSGEISDHHAPEDQKRHIEETREELLEYL